MSERWHTVDGRPVRSLVAGDQRVGVPELVVVPGLGALGYLLPTVAACAAWTRVHLLDVPGFGDPRTAHLPSELDAISRTVGAWLADVPSTPVLLLGHSTGAQAALHATLLQPARVQVLALGGATFAPAQRRPLPLVAQVLRTLVHERAGELPAVLPYYLRGRHGLPALVRTCLADRPEDVAAQVQPRRVVLRGRHDHLCPQAWAERLADEVVVLPGAHNAPYTHPAETAAALRALA